MRGNILDIAKEIINTSRQDEYGNPENNFPVIARRWEQLLSVRNRMPVQITPEDVAIMMADLKLARIITGSAKNDSFIDACGYIALAADMSKTNQGVKK